MRLVFCLYTLTRSNVKWLLVISAAFGMRFGSSKTFKATAFWGWNTILTIFVNIEKCSALAEMTFMQSEHRTRTIRRMMWFLVFVLPLRHRRRTYVSASARNNNNLELKQNNNGMFDDVRIVVLFNCVSCVYSRFYHYFEYIPFLFNFFFIFECKKIKAAAVSYSDSTRPTMRP